MTKVIFAVRFRVLLFGCAKGANQLIPASVLTFEYVRDRLNKDTRELLIFLLVLAASIAIYTITSPQKLSDPDQSITCHGPGPDCMYDR